MEVTGLSKVRQSRYQETAFGWIAGRRGHLGIGTRSLSSETSSWGASRRTIAKL
jgi:hypothetical protein